MTSRREYFASRPRVGALVALLLIVVGIGAGVLLAVGPRSLDVARNDPLTEVVRVLAFVVIGLFGAPLLAFAPLLRVRTPMLVIDEEGIVDGGTGLGMAAGRIRFADMARVSALSTGVDFVAIDLVDVDAFLCDRSSMLRATVRLNLFTGYPPITIPTGPMNVRADHVVAELLRARAACSDRRGT